MNEIKTIQIEILSPYTGEIETIEAGSEKNALVISTHLGEHVLVVTDTKGRISRFSGMNQWAALHNVFNGTANQDAKDSLRIHG